MMIRTDSLTLDAGDGQQLGATLFEPSSGSGGPSVLINGATGVPARYYAAFASYLAGRGCTVLTYDYRGIGASPAGAAAPAPRMLHWGTRDMPAAAAWLRRHRPGLVRTVIGHSFGGQILGLLPEAGEIAAGITIGAQHGYWRNWSGARQWRLFLVWHAAVPAVVAATGRLPGRLLGGEDLPAGVARDWARWCRNPHYLTDDAGQPLRPHNAAVRARLRMISFADDQDFGPRRGVDRLAGYYPGARIERLHVAPADWGLDRIGHFGFFKREMPAEHWAAQADWLLQAAGTAPAAAA